MPRLCQSDAASAVVGVLLLLLVSLSEQRQNCQSHKSKAEEENLAAKTAIRTQHREMENWYPGRLTRVFRLQGLG